jgi:hypothetical protein
MSQYPLDNNSDIVESVNYLLSGPTSIGQNFEGMSAVGVSVQYGVNLGVTATTQTYLTGMPILGPSSVPVSDPPAVGARYNQPGTVDNQGQTSNDAYPIWNTFPAGLTITNIVPVSATGREITVTFNVFGTGITGASGNPFVLGQQVVLSGITPSSFNGTYTVKIQPEPFTAGQVVLIQDVAETWGTYTSGGVIKLNDYALFTSQKFFTGNQAIVTVTGPTDRVFISSQMNNLILYTYTNFQVSEEGFFGVEVFLEINRYRAVQKTTLPDAGASAIYAQGGTAYDGYLWEFDASVVSVGTPIISSGPASTAVDSNDFGDVIYNNVIDNPGIGTYLYAFQISSDAYRDTSYPITQLIVGAKTTGVRSFTAQAIKR